MAQRRMFSNRIANSAKFLQMPTESQLLYFHLNLHADDDGIAEAYPIMKLLGISPDAFKVLLAKEYIQQLNEDQVIVISDWLEHNVIRADRKVDSIYKHLLPENIKTITPKPRSDVEDNSKRLNGQSTDGIGKVRLGKVRTGKDSVKVDETSSLDIPLVIKAFEKLNPASKKFYGIQAQRNACNQLIEHYSLSRVIEVVEKTLPKTNTMQYFPTITTPLQLWEKWAALESKVRQYQQEREIKSSKNKVAF